MTATGWQGGAAQQQALARYAILGTAPDPAFDELTGLARLVTGAQVAALGFHGPSGLWLKASTGLAGDRLVPVPEHPAIAPAPGWLDATSPEPSCAADPPTVDAQGAAGARRWSVPVCDGGRVFAHGAAAPVVTADGYVLGELIVLGDTPPAPDPERLAALTSLAGMALTRLELRRTLLTYHAVVDGVGHVVFQTDAAGLLLSVTPNWSRLTGFGIVRSVGQPLVSFVHPEDHARMAAHLDQLRDGNAAGTLDCRVQRLFGGDVPVEIICRPMVDETGHQHGLVGVLADITERRAREIEAQHAQKLEALGRMSAGLAHEINTPIQYVGDNTRFLADSYEAMLRLITAYRGIPQDPAFDAVAQPRREAVCLAEQEVDLDYLLAEIPPALRQTLDGVERVSTLVTAMRTLSQNRAQSHAPADLNEAIRAVVTVAVSQVRPVADIVTDLHPLPTVHCAVADLNQVFLNMVMNAADAIEDKGERGTITIGTERVGETGVRVRISDTGQGIPQELRLRIFEPFFTTKQVGRGTGQGLTLANAVIERHGGSIQVESAVGVGSTFVITLPVNGSVAGPGRG